MRPTIFTDDARSGRIIRMKHLGAVLFAMVNLGVWFGFSWCIHNHNGYWSGIAFCTLLINAIVFRAIGRHSNVASLRNMWPVQSGGMLVFLLGVAAFHQPPDVPNAALVAAVVGVMISWFSLLVWLDRPRIAIRGTCQRCGYSLQGLTHWRCPECGTEFGPEDIRH
jgi:hypothetical protein